MSVLSPLETQVPKEFAKTPRRGKCQSRLHGLGFVHLRCIRLKSTLNLGRTIENQTGLPLPPLGFGRQIVDSCSFGASWKRFGRLRQVIQDFLIGSLTNLDVRLKEKGVRFRHCGRVERS